MRTFSGRAGLAALAASAVIGAVALAAAQPAFAAQEPLASSLDLDASEVCPGDSVTFHATGFVVGQQTTVRLKGKDLELGRFNADAQGEVHETVDIPLEAHPGRHTFRVEAESPERDLSRKLVVKKVNECDAPDSVQSDEIVVDPGEAEPASAPQLAATGEGDTLGLFGGAAGLALLGGGAVMAARRFGIS
ncbi:hypothetical protein [Streptomyces sp. NPDC127084]|uniref:hypothetical protein n=1 Tax=Streptomyces sp. NPDC127084 TaxID=3347133 RepID=UPI0036479FC0